MRRKRIIAELDADTMDAPRSRVKVEPLLSKIVAGTPKKLRPSSRSKRVRWPALTAVIAITRNRILDFRAFSIEAEHVVQNIPVMLSQH
ncbi:hypothetical protein [Bradyrhizobium prioriisuperbiae]|uniref:hypothetical protein n=1 Tax=Bradyrhizobium prioriisuperbiae TaxID=2854389 RepID=UPI0028E22953|nr:hypothetical protein [Bradyrhizobium prioritasuperba]